MAQPISHDPSHEIQLDALKGVTTEVEKLEESTNGNDVVHVAVAGPQGTSNMTKAKWLACIALGFSYTTAFQQNACTAAIVKHIDTELGS
jgi:hypothetical protein